MSKRLTITEQDLVVVESRINFGSTGKRIGDIVEVLGYRMARFNRADGTAVYYEICWACDGSGFRPGMVLDHARCWPCRYSGLNAKMADGTPQQIVAKYRRREADAARREAKRQARLDADRVAGQVWAAEHPELVAIAQKVLAYGEDETNAYSAQLQSIAARVGVAELTDKQAAALTRIFAAETAKMQDIATKRAAEKAARGWIGQKGETVTFTGTPFFTKPVGQGYRKVTFCMFRTENGDTVKWFREGDWNPVRGTVVTVTGTVSKLEESEQYGKATTIIDGDFLRIEIDGEVTWSA